MYVFLSKYTKKENRFELCSRYSLVHTIAAAIPLISLSFELGVLTVGVFGVAF